MTFTNCVAVAITIQGDPYMSMSGQFSFLNNVPSSQSTFRTGGGITFTFNGVRGSAQYNCTDTINLQTGAFSSSGSVSWQYPVGTTVSGPGCNG